ncbi:MAG: flagellar assembly peptidoglycan hydrolase FlgJ [Stenotrophomonas sp.]|jgi:flagellar protein FlgJ|uniref:flagellar assembly peptidoglycan hydrolase FlgJ n=1 Tax=Stenotrophomonas TaxID=40323 RepID=UPI000C322E49|nr:MULTISPECIES: flagellar assembly peptidoglycan hydrolase FlgJ [Stenotrophomonas]MDX3932278.1 flagellar assembly peptidoglycan hydrolase FlgJ [Stenotrophomonas sp.]PKH72060.1 flagellar assembly peptidoglycan hydrolase FlgJ [Stenotrophomonas sp. Betaine-02u-21]PKH73283.1 flagellar assembly peptidoglycan hydrolase FlgJ [Stenotrophomonas sp. Betaine-02u-23]PKH97027.1 flagellar assembly peptidoglycan hydrolase FlgJ [Stenotrophomonas sp. Bg11-02]
MRIQPSFELNPSQRNDPAQVDKVARQLEGQFAQMLVKSMRDASFGDSLFPGENTMFREMYDQKIAESMTRGKGLGLSAVISRQLSGAAADGPALDGRINATEATRAYQLNAPAADAPAMPLEDADQAVRMLQQMAAGSSPRLLQPMEQTLDLIAGRDSSSMHQALGSSDPYAAQTLAAPAPVAAEDQWAATATNRGTGPSAIDTLASSSAVARLGSHTPEGFVAGIWAHAQTAAKELGVDARALVAQAALETGWGKRQITHGDGRTSHNLFGIKATGWSGDRATVGTHEYVNGARRNETASFRSYSSPAESFADYVRLLKSNPRYQKALEAGTDVRGFARGLQQAGYATDPSYANKIASIAGGPTIERAVAAIGDAGAQLGRTFASTAQAALGTARR